METIEKYQDLKSLEVNQQLYMFDSGKVQYYRFLCFHPRNEKYVILMNSCEQPERWFCEHMYGKFNVSCSAENILKYKMNYFYDKYKECENELKKLG